MMSKQQLFYESVVPVSVSHHKNLCIEHLDYTFAKGVNSVPLTAVEIPLAAREYTIVFTGERNAVIPVAVLGAEDNKNAYIDRNGKWLVNYIPAFVRRYPFVFLNSEDKKTFTLCIDERWAGCNQEGRGKRLFDDQSERTAYLNSMLDFMEKYQGHFEGTQEYCNKLTVLDLLKPMKFEFKSPKGESRSIGGFWIVDRDKIKSLPAAKLAELAQSDELELIYNHLQSLNNAIKMIKLAAELQAEQ